jgi:hypothetical protein
MNYDIIITLILYASSAWLYVLRLLDDFLSICLELCAKCTVFQINIITLTFAIGHNLS